MRPYIICHMMASLDGRIDCDMTEQIGLVPMANCRQLLVAVPSVQ